MKRILADLLDWKLQFKEYKPLVLTGSDEADRTKVIKTFAKEFFDNMLHINIKNNEEIRTYINTHEPDRDAYVYIEHALHDMIVPHDSLLIFNNADSLDRAACWNWAENFLEEEDETFFAIVGDFTEEELAEASRYATVLRLPAED